MIGLLLLAIFLLLIDTSQAFVLPFGRCVLQRRSTRPSLLPSINAVDKSTIVDGDLVEMIVGGTTTLGMVQSSGMVAPLCKRYEDPEVEGQLILFYDEGQVELSLAQVSVTAVVGADDWYLTNRALELGPANPHGEHAEDAFVIDGYDKVIGTHVYIPLGEGH